MLMADDKLEMETRMMLVPNTWEDPRDTPLDVFDVATENKTQ